MTRKNFDHIEKNFYVCYTQAGFKRALNDYSGRMRLDKNIALEDLVGYPTSYPSLVSFSWEYKGYHFVKASCVHVNQVLGKLLH